MTILDFNTVTIRHAYFISKRLKNFTYYGLVRENGFVNRNMNIVKEIIKGFDNIHFLSFKNDCLFEEIDFIDKVDFVCSRCTFTHTRFEDFKRCLKIFDPVIDKGGCLVMAALTHDKNHEYTEDNFYGHKNFYRTSYFNEHEFHKVMSSYKYQEVEDYWNFAYRNPIYRVEKIV